ncbi:MAG: hypothetical protein ACR2OA_03335 [Rubripirellula sp.]
MAKPSEADSDHGVDRKLDSLISPLQLLGGEGKRPASGDAKPPGVKSDAVTQGDVPESANSVEGVKEKVVSSEASSQARNGQARSVQWPFIAQAGTARPVGPAGPRWAFACWFHPQ